MKKLMFSLAGLLSVFQASAQNNDPYVSVTEQMIKHYNAQNYKGFYDLLSPGFKAQQSEKEISGFLKEVQAHYGKIKSIGFLKQKEEFRHYKTACEKGDLELLLACNEQKKIEGFSLQPYKEVPTVSKEIGSDNPKQNVFELEVDSLARAYLSEPANASLSIGILRNGQTQFYHYGEIRKGAGLLPSNNSIYEIGSITKTFTGILLAKAIEEQKVKADDDIRKYLPEACKNLAYKTTPVTLTQLANHTSGIPSLPKNFNKQKDFDGKDPYKNYTKQLLLEELSTLKLKVMPGTVNEYSNMGTALLGVILADVYGKSYAELVREKITGPLQMEQTWQVVPEEKKQAFCTGYNEQGAETSYWSFIDFASCGCLRSTVEDVMRYLRANQEEKDPAMALSHATTFQTNRYNSVGLAWQKQQSLSGDELIWHNGGTYGFSSFMGFSKSKAYGIVVLSNSGNNVDALSIQILKALKK